MEKLTIEQKVQGSTYIPSGKTRPHMRKAFKVSQSISVDLLSRLMNCCNASVPD